MYKMNINLEELNNKIDEIENISANIENDVSKIDYKYILNKIDYILSDKCSDKITELKQLRQNILIELSIKESDKCSKKHNIKKEITKYLEKVRKKSGTRLCFIEQFNNSILFTNAYTLFGINNENNRYNDLLELYKKDENISVNTTNIFKSNIERINHLQFYDYTEFVDNQKLNKMLLDKEDKDKFYYVDGKCCKKDRGDYYQTFGYNAEYIKQVFKILGTDNLKYSIDPETRMLYFKNDNGIAFVVAISKAIDK